MKSKKPLSKSDYQNINLSRPSTRSRTEIEQDNASIRTHIGNPFSPLEEGQPHYTPRQSPEGNDGSCGNHQY